MTNAVHDKINGGLYHQCWRLLAQAMDHRYGRDSVRWCVDDVVLDKTGHLLRGHVGIDVKHWVYNGTGEVTDRLEEAVRPYRDE
ncbi:hypothetical protein LCGC14_0909350 [marine sediment metagenome]|uniref:Uncharacterized protein n=1 Tax=marine sediment metagenome TaxID=412755 RepID=A0A0F9S0X3_9ZZZZ